MPVKVIDASALAAVVFDEPDADRVVHAIDDCRLVAPYLLEFELANVCARKVRAHPVQRGALLGALAFVDHLDLTRAEVVSSEVIELAIGTRLTAYDASYLWLARTLRCELVTLDKRLSAASRR
jgi:predicted nucleic acid-binding protein